MSRSNRQGQPLRFLLVVALCWIGGRLAVSHEWSPTQLQAGIKRASPNLQAIQPSTLHASRASIDLHHIAASTILRKPQPVRRRDTRWAQTSEVPMQSNPYISPPVIKERETAPTSFAGAPLISGQAGGGRWSASSWIFWRDASGQNSLASVGQLGGSQAGFRLAYQLLPNAPEKLALYSRITGALRGPYAPEAAVGISTQPIANLPVRVAVERRIALDHDARNAMAVMAVGGIGPLSMARGLILEGYGQAGIVGVHSRDAFVDGKVTLMHPIHSTLPISVGISLSGGAQPSVARFDIGPQIESRLKLGEHSARISAEWRHRAAGNARPGSGLAVTLATDF